MAKEVFMTGSKKTNEAPDALLDAASKDAKITKTELSEEELKDVSGGKHVANIKWTPGSSSAGWRKKYDCPRCVRIPNHRRQSAALDDDPRPLVAAERFAAFCNSLI
jgi:hypothetical protein